MTATAAQRGLLIAIGEGGRQFTRGVYSLAVGTQTFRESTVESCDREGWIHWNGARYELTDAGRRMLAAPSTRHRPSAPTTERKG